MSEVLLYSPTTHAHLFPVFHPRLNVEITGRSVVKYLRFLRDVRVDRLVLPRSVYGRWVPSVPVHPAHLIISTFNPATFSWDLVREVNTEPDPRIWGEGLSQSMSMAEMEAHFKRVIDEAPPLTVELDDLRTSLLRIECDREHP